MRKLLLAVVASATLVACGGGDDGDDVDTADDTTTTASTLAVGSTTTATAPPTGDPTATSATTTPAIPTDTTPIDPATIETLPPAPDPGPADPGFPPPELGTYTYQTTGNSAGGPVNGPTNTVVTALGPNEVRYAAAEQVLDLHYRGDGVYVRQLVARLSGQQLTFQSAEGVLFVPIPPTPGQDWEWSLTDSTGGLTAAWSATLRAPETITAAGAPVETSVVQASIHVTGQYDLPVFGRQPIDAVMDLTIWLDPGRRLPAQLHQVIRIRQPAFATSFGSDTTSTLTGFTPA